MDKTKQTSMIAANNSSETLSEIIKNVELICKAAWTWANLYVVDNVPFALLLGCPWQRDNQISIDERPDGTYLLFKNPFMPNLDELEMLIEPSSASSETYTLLDNPPQNGQLFRPRRRSSPGDP